ncbi:MAG: isochorismatase family protein [Planctomycetota bacterium]|jgi:nicotinamidase-related amidase
MVSGDLGTFPSLVVVDLNTQKDFCLAEGASPVVNAAALVPALRKVVAWVRRNGIPVVSSLDSHREEELADSSAQRYAVDGSDGQQKLDFTKLRYRTSVLVDNTLSVSLDLFQSYQQVVFRQRGEDFLANPKADRFLTQLDAKEFVVIGNVAESAVKRVALGLLARNKNVTLVPEACGFWDQTAAGLAFRLLGAKGVNIVPLDELLQRQFDKRWRYTSKAIALRTAADDPDRAGQSSGKRNGKRNLAKQAPGRLSATRQNGKIRPRKS